MQRQATKEGASSTTMNALGEHYAYVVDDIVKADYWYKQAIEKDGNPDALLNLCALHIHNKEWFFISEEKSSAYSEYIRSHARIHSKPRFMLDRHNLIKSLKHYHHTQNNAEITQFMQRMESCSITSTIMYHIICLQVPKKKKGVRTDSKNENLTYLSHITRYASGSTGDDSDYNIDYTTSYTDKNAILAQFSTIPIPTLIGYYQKTNSSVNLQYWETYRQCMGEKRTFFPEASPAEEKQIGIFLGTLMGDDVRSSSKFQGSSFIITAALLPTIDAAQRERAKMRLTAYNVPFREEKDGTLLIPETTHAELYQAYRTMMRLHQAHCKSTAPTSMVTATSSITDQKSGGKQEVER